MYFYIVKKVDEFVLDLVINLCRLCNKVNTMNMANKNTRTPKTPNTAAIIVVVPEFCAEGDVVTWLVVIFPEVYNNCLILVLYVRGCIYCTN